MQMRLSRKRRRWYGVLHFLFKGCRAPLLAHVEDSLAYCCTLTSILLSISLFHSYSLFIAVIVKLVPLIVHRVSTAFAECVSIGRGRINRHSPTIGRPNLPLPSLSSLHTYHSSPPSSCCARCRPRSVRLSPFPFPRLLRYCFFPPISRSVVNISYTYGKPPVSKLREQTLSSSDNPCYLLLSLSPFPPLPSLCSSMPIHSPSVRAN